MIDRSEETITLSIDTLDTVSDTAEDDRTDVVYVMTEDPTTHRTLA